MSPQLKVGLIFTFAIVTAIYLLAHAIYELRRPGQPGYPKQMLRCPDGREGKLVSWYPFDIRVSVNVAATPEERKILEEEALARNSGWKRPGEGVRDGENVELHFANARHWVSCWRWQVVWLPLEPDGAD